MDETLHRPTPSGDTHDPNTPVHLLYAYLDRALECEEEGDREDAELLYRGANEALREILSENP